MTLARRFINGRQQILLKKKPCRLFSKDTHILSPIIFLILCKNLVRTWLLWQTNWPLGQGTFFLHVTQNMGWSYWNAYDGSIEGSYKPCLIISALHHLVTLELNVEREVLFIEVSLKWTILSQTSTEGSGKNIFFWFFLLGLKYTLRTCFESKNFLRKSRPELSNQVLSFSACQICY